MLWHDPCEKVRPIVSLFARSPNFSRSQVQAESAEKATDARGEVPSFL